MSASEDPSIANIPNTLNMLVLDGGGVKGLSSLIILRSLLHQVERLVSEKPGLSVREGSLRPHQVFNLVVGTSTGGLIALMVGKLGMSVDECIRQYHTLSHQIFHNGRHPRGTTFHGFVKPKYCGRLMREQVDNLFRQQNRDAGLPMITPGYTDCAVVCRKYDNRFERNPPLVDIPSVICSHRCREYIECSICDAARATSAAPTYFSEQRIGGHVFIDGGVGCNNPSWAAYDHYNNANKYHHSGMTWRGARMVNLGTGTCSPEHSAPTPSGFFRSFRMTKVINLLRDTATNSEFEAAKVRTLAVNANFDYQRFSADTGVCWIKMDEYQRLEEIESLTNQYLSHSAVRERLGKCAEGLASDYVRRLAQGGLDG
ncbi:hypothetical protein FGG08_005506 [Glutinoglossum americanum]|uniref:PNPLA domain-containing protein n=1 Tax=Glutinoglossum americanum TaxID=1670608 RepID=A0A9P8I2V7_9PEZI|nr:hypothetical protein FGG08_005506 [Glutinoglossum americanum]